MTNLIGLAAIPLSLSHCFLMLSTPVLNLSFKFVTISPNLSNTGLMCLLYTFTILSFIQDRSEEYTSELQSRGHLVCRLLLVKKKQEERLTELSNSTHERTAGPAGIGAPGCASWHHRRRGARV